MSDEKYHKNPFPPHVPMADIGPKPLTDEKQVIVEKLEPIPDFEAMPFEELFGTPSIPEDEKFNDALWSAQSDRYTKLNIAQLDDFESVEDYQDRMDARLKKLEAKFKALTKLIDAAGDFQLPRISLDQYLEDKTK